MQITIVYYIIFLWITSNDSSLIKLHYITIPAHPNVKAPRMAINYFFYSFSKIYCIYLNAFSPYLFVYNLNSREIIYFVF